MITEDGCWEVDGTERSRTVYLESCARIAEAFADRGFKYAKSGPRISRQEGDWKQTVSFGSSHYNAPGAHVALWIYAELRNTRLKKWRATHGSYRENRTYHDMVAIGQIGNISPPHDWLEWELADVAIRDRTIANAVETVEQTVLPWFEQFKNLPSLVDTLLAFDGPCLHAPDALELALCYLGEAEAIRYVSGWLIRHADLSAELERFVRFVKAKGAPWLSDQRVHACLAKSIVFFDLPIPQLGKE